MKEGGFLARPSKSIGSQSRHNTKAEIKLRKENEEKLKGLADKIDKHQVIYPKNKENI